MKHLLIILALALCVASSPLAAQGPSQLLYRLPTSSTLGYQVGQSITLTHAVSSIRVAVFTRHHHTDVPAMLYVIRGHGSQGDTVMAESVTVHGLDMLHPYVPTIIPADMQGFTAAEMEQVWTAVQAPINDGTLSFEQMSTEFPLDFTFEPGVYTFLWRADDSVTRFGNCHSAAGFGCFGQDNPYEGGRAYGGPDPIATNPLDDMAFRVKYDLSTSLDEYTLFTVPIRNNVITFPTLWDGGTLFVRTLSGQLVETTTIRGGAQLELSGASGCYIVTVVDQDGRSRSARIVRVDG